MKIVCIVLGSGSSTRFGNNQSKLFYKVKYHSVIEHTLKNISKSFSKDCLYITIPKKITKKGKWKSYPVKSGKGDKIIKDKDHKHQSHPGMWEVHHPDRQPRGVVHHRGVSGGQMVHHGDAPRRYSPPPPPWLLDKHITA